MATKQSSQRTTKPRTAVNASTSRAPAAGSSCSPARARTRTTQGLPDDVFAELLESVRDGGRILRGEQAPAREYDVDPADPDVAGIRERMGLSQSRFAYLLGISPRTLQGWEQGRRAPKGAERTLLRVAAKHPAALLDVAG